MLSVGVPHAVLAINNLTKELEQQAADEKADRLSAAVEQEEAIPEGVYTFRGEVLRIKRDNYLIRKYTGDVIHLHLDANTLMTTPVRPGDRIEAKVNDQGHVLQIHPVL
jgi:acyl dehydratase